LGQMPGPGVLDVAVEISHDVGARQCRTPEVDDNDQLSRDPLERGGDLLALFLFGVQWCQGARNPLPHLNDGDWTVSLGACLNGSPIGRDRSWSWRKKKRAC